MIVRHELVAICQTPGSIPSHFPPLHSRSIKQGSKDCWHLVEALGSVTWPIPHCIFDRLWVENLQPSDFPLPGSIFLRFSPAIWVLLYSDTIQTVLETSEWFLSIYAYSRFYGWVAGSLLWAPLGTLFIQATQYCPPVTKKLTWGIRSQASNTSRLL
jgi:hypothetical protein